MTADAVGGVWSYALNLASGLAARDIEVTIAVMGPRPDEGQTAAAARRGIQVVHGPFALEWMNDPWADVARAGEWLVGLERDVAPDVVHLNGYCHAVLPWQSPVLVVAHSCVRSWWRAVHGTSPPAEWNRYSLAVRSGLLAANLVVAPTSAMCAAVEAEYGPLPATMVIPNGSASVEQIDRSFARKFELVLTAGRVWDEAKNIQALCDVAPSLDWPVYVAGDVRSPDGGSRCTHNVEMLGRLALSAMEDWYARAAIYALPARYEPFGLSVLEAAAAGCALVLGDIASLRENWHDAAVFVDPADRVSLARALETLIHDAVRRAELGERARARATTFTLPRMADGYVAAYARVTEAAVSSRALLHAS